MAGADLASKLGEVSYSLAERADDAAIRRLLRETPMGGGVSLTMRQEPSYFLESTHLPGGHRTIVAKLGETLVAVGGCAIRPRYVNGAVSDVGYLRTLRLAAPVAGRFDILRRGYAFLRDQWEEWGSRYLFTSIAAENVRALRFLERGLPGMPRYRFLCEFVTLILPVSQRWGKADAIHNSEPGLAEIAECLSRHRHNLSPAWSTDSLRGLEALNLNARDFAVIRERGRIVACAAVWDQRPFKQTVVHRYGMKERTKKRVFNLLAPILRQPGMPEEGAICPFGMASHFVSSPAYARSLVQSLLSIAAQKGIQFLCLGFAENDPVLAMVRPRFFAHTYRTRLYQVDWPDLPAAPIPAENLSPEIALL